MYFWWLDTSFVIHNLLGILTLTATCKPTIRKNIVSLFIIGTFNQAPKTCRHILSNTNEEYNMYKLRLILNIIRHSKQPDVEVIQGLRCAIDDLGDEEQ
ncbi:unnamed protein product, partial [marine sediment metagenome]